MPCTIVYTRKNLEAVQISYKRYIIAAKVYFDLFKFVLEQSRNKL